LRNSASGRRRRRAALAGLFCLVAFLVAAPQGLVRAVERFAALSFDNPATQLLDDLTCEKASPGDRLFEATERLRAVAATFHRLRAHERVASASKSALSPRPARAPPTA
jgi:hypothetical protein